MIWMLFGIIIVLCLGVILYQYRQRSRAFEAFEALADELGFETISSTEAEGQLEGMDCRIEYYTLGHSSTGFLFLCIESGLPENLPDARFRVESVLDRVGKFLGLGRDYQSGESEFDEAIYVQGDRERLQYFIRKPQLRTAIQASVGGKRRSLKTGSVGLLKSGWVGLLNAGSEGLYLTILNPFGGSFGGLFGLSGSVEADGIKEDFQKLKRVVEALRVAADEVPASPPASSSFPSDAAELKNIVSTLILLGFPLLAFVGGFGGLVFVVDQYPVFTYRLVWEGLQISGIVALLYLAIMFVTGRLNPTSTSHEWFFVGAMALLIGLPPTAYTALVFTNAYWDPHPPAVVPARIMEVNSGRSGDGQSEAELKASFNGVTGRPEMDVSNAVAKRLRERLRRGQPVHLTVGPGYWQEPWVVELKLNP